MSFIQKPRGAALGKVKKKTGRLRARDCLSGKAFAPLCFCARELDLECRRNRSSRLPGTAAPSRTALLQQMLGLTRRGLSVPQVARDSGIVPRARVFRSKQLPQTPVPPKKGKYDHTATKSDEVVALQNPTVFGLEFFTATTEPYYGLLSSRKILHDHSVYHTPIDIFSNPWSSLEQTSSAFFVLRRPHDGTHGSAPKRHCPRTPTLARGGVWVT